MVINQLMMIFTFHFHHQVWFFRVIFSPKKSIHQSLQEPQQSGRPGRPGVFKRGMFPGAEAPVGGICREGTLGCQQQNWRKSPVPQCYGFHGSKNKYQILSRGFRNPASLKKTPLGWC